MSVEQNLADQVALLAHVRSTYKLTGPAVATGGSYAGASASWLRTAHPNAVDAAIAESGPIHADVDFWRYDAALARALSYRKGCAERMAATMAAIDALWAEGPDGQDALKRGFNASALIGTPQGDTDFLYFLGDSVATAIQYGGKARVCDALALLPAAGTGAISPAVYVANWQNYTFHSLGPRPTLNGCFYDSECMKRENGTTSARAWYWLKCSQLAYLQASPEVPAQAAVSMRPTALTADRLVAQCHYIFGSGLSVRNPADGVQAFNTKFGGFHPEKVGQTKVGERYLERRGGGEKKGRGGGAQRR
jgi:hypothetical protein